MCYLHHPIKVVWDHTTGTATPHPTEDCEKPRTYSAYMAASQAWDKKREEEERNKYLPSEDDGILG